MKHAGKARQRRTSKSAQQRSHERLLRAARRNPITRLIIAHKKEIRRRVEADAQLSEDFGFLLEKTGWLPDLLLSRLYWDANMMHADAQTVIGKEKVKIWPIDRKTLGRSIGTFAYSVSK